MENLWNESCKEFTQREKVNEKIGILGGTYDPVHLGHTDIAQKIFNEFSLSFICLMASGDPPHKNSTAPAYHRLNMLKIASENIPFIQVSEIEMNRQGKIYTVDTLKLIKKAKPKAKLYYIIGSDTVFELETWRDFKTVFELTEFICMDRVGVNIIKTRIKAAELKENFGAKIYFSQYTGKDVSSSLIRKRLSEGKDVSEFLNSKVKEYIKLNGLYK